MAPKNHPAILIGKMIKDRRVSIGEVSRRFWVNMIGVQPSVGTEIEHGINLNIHISFVTLCRIIAHCGFNDEQAFLLWSLTKSAKEQPNLKMKDIFTREELMPIFLPPDKANRVVDEIMRDRVEEPKHRPVGSAEFWDCAYDQP